MYKLLPNDPLTKEIAQYAIRIIDNVQFGYNILNPDYQRFLDDINEHGVEIVDGEIPEHVLTQAADKKFKQQLSKYTEAVARLSQYVLSQGRAETKKMISTGQTVFNEETMEMEMVLEEVTVHAEIDPVPLTIQVSEMNNTTMEMITTTMDNPAVVQDLEQRAAAEAIQAATPPDVVTAYENSLKT